MSQLLLAKAAMLKEYVGVCVDASARLVGIPVLLDGYIPDLSLLPELVLRLGRDVDWDDEAACFRTLAEVTMCTLPLIVIAVIPLCCVVPGVHVAESELEQPSISTIQATKYSAPWHLLSMFAKPPCLQHAYDVLVVQVLADLYAVHPLPECSAGQQPSSTRLHSAVGQTKPVAETPGDDERHGMVMQQADTQHNQEDTTASVSRTAGQAAAAGVAVEQQQQQHDIGPTELLAVHRNRRAREVFCKQVRCMVIMTCSTLPTLFSGFMAANPMYQPNATPSAVLWHAAHSLLTLMAAI